MRMTQNSWVSEFEIIRIMPQKCRKFWNNGLNSLQKVGQSQKVKNVNCTLNTEMTSYHHWTLILPHGFYIELFESDHQYRQQYPVARTKHGIVFAETGRSASRIACESRCKLGSWIPPRRNYLSTSHSFHFLNELREFGNDCFWIIFDVPGFITLEFFEYLHFELLIRTNAIRWECDLWENKKKVSEQEINKHKSFNFWQICYFETFSITYYYIVTVESLMWMHDCLFEKRWGFWGTSHQYVKGDDEREWIRKSVNRNLLRVA
jgi:hypothetical protein